MDGWNELFSCGSTCRRWQSSDEAPVPEVGVEHSGEDKGMADMEEASDRHQAAGVEVLADSYPGEEGGVDVDMGRPHVEDPGPLSARVTKSDGEGRDCSYRVMRRGRVSTMLLTWPLAGRRIGTRCSMVGRRRVLSGTRLGRRRVVTRAAFVSRRSSLRRVLLLVLLLSIVCSLIALLWRGVLRTSGLCLRHDVMLRWLICRSRR
jgi:hypothetical protein